MPCSGQKPTELQMNTRASEIKKSPPRGGVWVRASHPLAQLAFGVEQVLLLGARKEGCPCTSQNFRNASASPTDAGAPSQVWQLKGPNVAESLLGDEITLLRTTGLGRVCTFQRQIRHQREDTGNGLASCPNLEPGGLTESDWAWNLGLRNNIPCIFATE